MTPEELNDLETLLLQFGQEMAARAHGEESFRQLQGVTLQVRRMRKRHERHEVNQTFHREMASLYAEMNA